MDHHAGAIDIGDFEMESLVKSQAARIDGGQIGVVVKGFDVGQKASGLIRLRRGKTSFGLGSKDSEDVPTLV